MTVFQPPTVLGHPPVDAYPRRNPLGHRLFRYYDPRAKGRTVLKIAGVYATYDYPSQDQVDSASEVYLGGHLYDVDDTTAAALTAAGYGAFLA